MGDQRCRPQARAPTDEADTGSNGHGQPQPHGTGQAAHPCSDRRNTDKFHMKYSLPYMRNALVKFEKCRLLMGTDSRSQETALTLQHQQDQTTPCCSDHKDERNKYEIQLSI